MMIFAFAVMAIFFMPRCGLGWCRHINITSEVLKTVLWVATQPELTVGTPQIWDESINPAYRPMYVNDNPKAANWPQGKFDFCDTASPAYHFTGRAVGENATVGQVLSWYSDEPDWGMDKDLDLDFAQKLMGGSQGYRHMFYPKGTWHLPYFYRAQGKAPERLAWAYGMSKKAFAMGDRYWGFRFLAWAVHLAQDLANPFHTTQAPFTFYNGRHLIDGTINTTSNYHFAYETYQAQLLSEEIAAGSTGKIIDAITQAQPLEVKKGDLIAFGERIAEQSVLIGEKLFPTTVPVLGEKQKSKQLEKYTQADYSATLNHPRYPELESSTIQAVTLAAQAAKGLLIYAEKDIPEITKK